MNKESFIEEGLLYLKGKFSHINKDVFIKKNTAIITDKNTTKKAIVVELLNSLNIETLDYNYVVCQNNKTNKDFLLNNTTILKNKNISFFLISKNGIISINLYLLSKITDNVSKALKAIYLANS